MDWIPFFIRIAQIWIFIVLVIAPLGFLGTLLAAFFVSASRAPIPEPDKSTPPAVRKIRG